MSRPKENKTRKADSNVAGRDARATVENSMFVCDTTHISKVTAELCANGIGLSSASQESQRFTLIRDLLFRGSRAFIHSRERPPQLSLPLPLPQEVK